MKYISNAFSPKMLNPKQELNLQILQSSYEEIEEEKDELISSIGHQNIADYLDIEKNRMNIQLENGDIIYLVQIYHDEEKVQQYDYWKIIVGDE